MNSKFDVKISYLNSNELNVAMNMFESILNQSLIGEKVTRGIKYKQMNKDKINYEMTFIGKKDPNQEFIFRVFADSEELCKVHSFLEEESKKKKRDNSVREELSFIPTKLITNNTFIHLTERDLNKYLEGAYSDNKVKAMCESVAINKDEIIFFPWKFKFDKIGKYEENREAIIDAIKVIFKNGLYLRNQYAPYKKTLISYVFDSDLVVLSFTGENFEEVSRTHIDTPIEILIRILLLFLHLI